jgi:hypothetical protein
MFLSKDHSQGQNTKHQLANELHIDCEPVSISFRIITYSYYVPALEGMVLDFKSIDKNVV